MCGQTELENDVEVNEQERGVGTELEYLEDARVGETIRFYYTGGSENGERTVRVAKVDGESIEGPTLEREGGYRRYNDYDASDIKIVAPFVLPGEEQAVPVADKAKYTGKGGELRVNFADAQTKLLASLTGEQLAELYSRFVAVEGEGAVFDANKGEVVVKLPEPKYSQEYNGSVHYFRKGKALLRIHGYTGFGNSLGIHRNDDDGKDVFDSIHGNAETLYEQLGKFLGK